MLHFHAQMCLQMQTTEDRVGLVVKISQRQRASPPLGMTEFDQSKALFQVKIAFQLLKLMNSLYGLMKSSAASKADTIWFDSGTFSE